MTSVLTKKSVLKHHKQYSKLINGVLKGLGGTITELRGTIKDITEHGAGNGFGSFCYYSDTHPFAMKHRKQIVMLLQQQANDFGMEIVEMVSGFGQFRSEPIDNETKNDLYKYIGGGKLTIENNITNLMSWYALEEVCRWFIND